MEAKAKLKKACNNNDCLQCADCWTYLRATSVDQDEIELINLAKFETVKEDNEYITRCKNFVKL